MVATEIRKIAVELKDSLPVSEFAWIPYKSYKVYPHTDQDSLTVYRKNEKIREIYLRPNKAEKPLDAYVEDVSDRVFPSSLKRWKLRDIKFLLEDIEVWF